MNMNKLQVAYHNYEESNWTEALRIYSEEILKCTEVLDRATIKTIIASIHLNLCNYNESYKLYQQVLTDIRELKPPPELLLIKIFCGLLVIELVSTEEAKVYQCAEALIETIRNNCSLYEVTMQTLFGVSSFEELYRQSITVKTEIEHKSKEINAYLCCTLALLEEITEGKGAYLLQVAAYEIALKNKEYILAAVCCRHLIRLSKKLDSSVREKYVFELKQIMNHKDIKGIPEETLFKYCEEKINYASSVVKYLKQVEEEIKVGKKCQWKKIIIVKRLENMINEYNKEEISFIISCIDKNNSLNFMLQNQFVKNIIEKYEENISTLKFIVEKIIKKELFYSFKVLNYFKEEQKKNIKESFEIKRYAPKREINIYLEPTEEADMIKEKEESPLVKINVNKEPFIPRSKPIKSDYHSSLLKPFHNPSGTKYQSNFEPRTAIETETTSNLFLNNPNVKKFSSILNEFEKRESSFKYEHSISEKSEIPFENNRYTFAELEPTTIKHFAKNKLNLEPSEESLSVPFAPKFAINTVSNTPNLIQKTESTSFFLGSKLNSKDVFRTKETSLNKCISGQYIMKRHYTSDGGEQRFLQLSKDCTRIVWAASEEQLKEGKSSEYLMADIKGVLYGKYTATMCKESNRSLESWRCFSLIFKKRTFDIYCENEQDLLFWLPGLSSCIHTVFRHPNYYDNRPKKERIKQTYRDFNIKTQLNKNNNMPYSFYSLGKVLWKKMLLRLQSKYIKRNTKDKYYNANAYAIIMADKKLSLLEKGKSNLSSFNSNLNSKK